jgi:uncharacterized protein (TIGR02246 family)
MLRRSVVLAGALALGAGVGCAPQPAPPDTAGAKASLQDTDARYGKAIKEKDKDAFLAFYAADAVMCPPGLGTLTGHAAIGGFMDTVLADPAFAVNIAAATVEVSTDGTLGTTYATGQVTLTGPDGKPATENIRDLHVWRRQPDGSWKLAIDVWNAEAAPAAEPKEE